MNIIIRLASEADYSSVNSLHFQTYKLYRQNIPESYRPTPPIVLSKGDFFNIIKDKNALMLVAEVDGKVVGQLYAFVEKYEGDEVTTGYNRVEIGEISIVPENVRQGIGTKLMKEVEIWAKTKQITELSTLVYDFNKEAIEFYRSNDYKPYSIKMNKKIIGE